MYYWLTGIDIVLMHLLNTFLFFCNICVVTKNCVINKNVHSSKKFCIFFSCYQIAIVIPKIYGTFILHKKVMQGFIINLNIKIYYLNDFRLKINDTILVKTTMISFFMINI